MSRSLLPTFATNSNGIVRTMPFWDEVIAETVGEYPTATPTSELVDALAAQTPWGRAGPAR